MNIARGTILISTPALDDTNFEKVVVLITEHNEQGATGFVLNKLFPRKLNALEEFRHDVAFPLYEGGPMDQEHLFFIHQRADLISESNLINGSIYFGGDFKAAVKGLNDGIIKANEIKIFVGYCGWDDQQLEEEIEEGSWVLFEGNAEMLFDEHPDGLWEKKFRQQNNN